MPYWNEMCENHGRCDFRENHGRYESRDLYGVECKKWKSGTHENYENCESRGPQIPQYSKC